MAYTVPTWNNVAAPRFDNSGLDAAQRSFNTGMEAFNGILKRRETISDANYEQGKLNNRDELFDTLYGAKTMPELEALRSSGVIDAMKKRMGSQIANRNEFNAADAGYGHTLQQREIGNIQHAGTVADELDRPKRDLAATLYAQGKIAEGDAVAAQVQRNKAPLFDLSKRTAREAVVNAQQDSNFNHQQRMQPLQEQAARLSAAASRQSLESGRLALQEKSGDVGVGNYLGKAAESLKAEQAVFLQKYAKNAASLDIPLNKAGEPVLNDVSLEKLDQLRQLSGDAPNGSAFLANFENTLSKAGVKPEKQMHYKELAGKLFSNGSITTEADAKEMEALIKQRTDARKAEMKNNSVFTGSIQELNEDKERTLKNYDAKAGNMSLVSDHRDKIVSLLEDGLDIGGKKVTVTPKMMDLALATSMDTKRKASNWFLVNTKDNVEKWLTNYVLNNPQYQTDLAKAEILKADPGDMIGIAKIRNNFRNSSGVSGSVQNALTTLDSHIEVARNRLLNGTGAVAPKK